MFVRVCVKGIKFWKENQWLLNNLFGKQKFSINLAITEAPTNGDESKYSKNYILKLSQLTNSIYLT